MGTKACCLIIALLITTGVLASQTSPGGSTRIDNEYLEITALPGWTAGWSADHRLTLVKGKYLLTIDPVFDHASPVEGGRFSEIVMGIRSVDAVMKNVDGPASGGECAFFSAGETETSTPFPLSGLYTDSSKTGNGCVFPDVGPPAWFGSFRSGRGPESEYTITLSYDTSEVNDLPRKGSAQLEQIFSEVDSMLKTMRLKAPITISKISPKSASPGEKVTLYGSGFRLSNSTTNAILDVNGPYSLASVADLNFTVAEDGKSLAFEVPTSILTVSCQEGRIWTNGFCLPIPPDHVDVNDCPRNSDGSANFCGIPTPPATYHIVIGVGPVTAEPVTFTITAAQARPVSISLMYPVSFVSQGDIVTIRGSGFVERGNRVRIGDTIVEDLSSDGKTITFRAPEPTGTTLVRGTRTFKASVLNRHGESNWIWIAYR